VLSGDPPAPGTAAGNQLLSGLFGAQLHFTGTPDHHWGELEIRGEIVTDGLAEEGLRPYSIPIGGSTPTGALGYAAGFLELLDQLDERGTRPAAIVFTSSSGGTHAGLLAGRAAAHAAGREVPPIVAIGVAKGVVIGYPDIVELARDTLTLMGAEGAVTADDVEVDDRWLGDDYGVPTAAGDAAIHWAARHGGWLMDRTYSGKGFSGLLGAAEAGRFGAGDDVVFVHTGGWPALFAPDGAPLASLP
jgi:1-aminocyclopropane-1-carboxylate deaminase/D-cysteine desulfhydrase-like pyridoxal-dependent ACC family enzyme